MRAISIVIGMFAAACCAQGLQFTAAWAAPSGGGARSADVAIAGAGVFVADDFPQGWVGTKPSTFKGADAALATTRGCKMLQTARVASKKAPGKAGQDFSNNSEKASSSVRVLPDQAAAAKIYDAYSSSQSQQCLAAVVKADGLATLGYDINVTTGQITGSKLGDASTRMQLQVAVPKTGTFQQKSYLDVTYVQTGRAVAVYVFQHDFNDSTTQNLPNQLMDAALHRLTAALSGQPITSSGALLALGSTATAGDGGQVTVYSYQAGVPGKFSLTPQEEGGAPGAAFGAVDVQICAPQSAGTDFFGNAFNFKLTFPDNTSAQSQSSQKDPQLQANNLGAGQCARGFVGFIVPPNRTPSAIVYAAGGGKPLQWKAS